MGRAGWSRPGGEPPRLTPEGGGQDGAGPGENRRASHLRGAGRMEPAPRENRRASHLRRGGHADSQPPRLRHQGVISRGEDLQRRRLGSPSTEPRCHLVVAPLGLRIQTQFLGVSTTRRDVSEGQGLRSGHSLFHNKHVFLTGQSEVQTNARSSSAV